MLLLSKGAKFQKFGKQIDLDTSHVTVNQMHNEQFELINSNLNTSHVTVNPLFFIKTSFFIKSLNTSHVTVNP